MRHWMRRLKIMDKKVSYFYRVHVKLEDPESDAHLAFDFSNPIVAIDFAEKAYKACDINKVWLEIVTNEIDTVESPMWRS